MHPVVDDVWALAREDQWPAQDRLTQCRDLWNEHTHAATWAGFYVAGFCVHEMAGGTPDRPVAVSPNEPPREVLTVLGDRNRSLRAMHKLWYIIGGAMGTVEVADPFLGDELREASREFKGTAVYLLMWMANSSLAHLEATRPVEFAESMGHIHGRLDAVTWND
jgi:hypothetical protein